MKNDEESSLFDKRFIRLLLIVLIPFAVFLLICAGIRVSSLGIKHTIVVHGSEQMVPGTDYAMRIALIDDQKGFFVPSRLSARIEQNGKSFVLFGGKVRESGYLTGRTVSVPALRPGKALMVINVSFGDKKRIIRKQIKVVKRLDTPRLQIPDDLKRFGQPAEAVKDEVRYSLYSNDRGVPAGLASQLYVLAVKKDAEGVASSFSFARPTFSPAEKKTYLNGRTNRFGIAVLPVKLVDLHYPLTLDKEQILYPRAVFSGTSLRIPKPLPTEGQRVSVEIERMSAGQPVYVDFYRGGNWLHGATAWTDDSGRAVVHYMPREAGTYRVQVSGSALWQGSDIAVGHFYKRKSGETKMQALQQLLAAQPRGYLNAWAQRAGTQLGKEGGGWGADDRLLLQFVLALHYNGYQPVNTLVSSRVNDDKELMTFKSTFQQGVMVIILLLGFCTAVIIAVIARQTARQRAHRMSLVLEGLDDDSTAVFKGERASARKIDRQNLFQIAVIFLVIVAAFAAAAILVATLTWHR